MKKTSQIIVLAALCLNICYGQDKQSCSEQPKALQKNKRIKAGVQPVNSTVNQPYKYAFSGFKSGYKCGYRISDDEFMKGKSITVRNYTVTQLFALAMGAGEMKSTLVQAEKIVINVRQPEKLNQIRCYQLVVPFYLTDNFYVIMQQSLNEEFPEYIVKMERREGGDFMVIKDREY
ncbi:MAG: hypothetical protein V4594_01895 [Bacteroidota bacterium]